MQNLEEILLPLLNKGNVLSIYERSTVNKNLLKEVSFKNNIKYSFNLLKSFKFLKHIFIFTSLRIQDQSRVNNFIIYSIPTSKIYILNLVRRILLYFSIVFIKLFLFEPMPIMLGLRKGKIFVGRSIFNKRRFEIKIIKIHLVKIIIKEALTFLKNLFFYKMLVINDNTILPSNLEIKNE